MGGLNGEREVKRGLLFLTFARMSLSCAVGKLMTQIEGMAGEWERAPRTQMGSRPGGDKMLLWGGSE